jgi:hypothetical protein
MIQRRSWTTRPRVPRLLCCNRGNGFSPNRLRVMLLEVDKRRKGQDGAAEEEEDSSGGDNGAVLKAHARSGAGDGGCVCFVPSTLVSILHSSRCCHLVLSFTSFQFPWHLFYARRKS